MIINKIPKDLTLTQYFDQLDPFEKRQLLDELETYKSFTQHTIDKFKPYFILVILSSVLGIWCMPTLWSILYFTTISGVMTWFWLKKVKTVKMFTAVHQYLTSRLV